MSAFLHETAGNSLNYFIDNGRNREKKVQALFEFLFYKSLKEGEIYISKNEKGVIMVERSEKKSFSLFLFLKKLIVIFYCFGFMNLSKISKRQKLLEQFHNVKPFVHPVAMAAHESVKGQGTCVRMILQLLKENKGSGQTVYTETTTEENLKIYRNFGFKVIGKSDELGFPMYFLKLEV